MRVSLADKLDNARTIVRDYRSQGEDLWLRWGRRAEDVRWYYDVLAERFADLRPGSLAEELRRTVAELDSLLAESGQRDSLLTSCLLQGSLRKVHRTTCRCGG